MDIVKTMVAGSGLTKCRLAIRTEIVDEWAMQEKFVKDEVYKSMSTKLAKEMMSKGTMNTYQLIHDYTKVYEMKVWSFSDEQLEELLKYTVMMANKMETL